MSERKYPPGPKGELLFGHFRLVTRDPLGFLSRCAREYGDVVGLRMLHLRSFFLRHPNDIEKVLVTHNRNFIKGRILRSNRRVFGNGLLVSEGDFWLRQRRLAQPAFHRERVAGYGRTMVAAAARMIEGWRDGETRDVHEEMMRLTLGIVAETLFGAQVERDAPEVGRAMAFLSERALEPRSFLPFLQKISTSTQRRLEKEIQRLDAIIYGIIAERRASGQDTGDLLSMLLRAQDEDGSRMSDQQVRDEALTLFLAGHETTAIALAWTWYLLAQHPKAEAKLHAEIDAVLGGHAPGADDLPRLRYAEHVMTEAMRLYPPAWGMARLCVKETEIAGYTVRPGNGVTFSQWVVHRDPRWYEQPEAFLPERWEGDLAKRLPKFAYFPFGGGPRVCIGNSFAMMEAALLLTTIAQRFRLRLVPEHKVELLPGITLRPKNGIRVTLEKR